jgi:hypothetical protein
VQLAARWHERHLFVQKVGGTSHLSDGRCTARKTCGWNPDEVYAYSRRLIEEIGPEGFILSQGCDMPGNAKPKNYRAMIAAAHA